MTETETIEQLKSAGFQMYTALTMISALHDEAEQEFEGEQIVLCSHCSALANAIVRYPCPTIELLTSDYPEEFEATSEPSVPAE